ncbi:choice-of-anchor Q domain-containing protein [Pedosphaera parvula]|uniref:Polymorphic outer membrane protein n=1 Tax=Pedosphaera parvula (strain Ellin514) TaxID=320771 RepID=B9XDC9_PEDPL|nr:choice-of-anchor Q domain-containing protein [Pedosphaera parvula]EEF62075.1 hypothetical protein Cflav_PD6350 [Pedosphaera parvula Ellin514]
MKYTLMRRMKAGNNYKAPSSLTRLGLFQFKNRQISAVLLASILLLCATVRGWAATTYVNINNHAPSAPYATWATAATNIQDAVDAAAPGDVVLVNDGVYQTGWRTVGNVNNRVAVTKPLTLVSVNGPGVTMILGLQFPMYNSSGVRCVYLTNGVVLSGFTLMNGGAQGSGGGVWCASTNVVVTNCVILNNSASSSGGGVYFGTLNNCIISGNSSYADYWSGGGGAYSSILNNCILRGNSAYNGGGAYSGMLNNCILSNNNSTSYGYGGGAYNGTLSNCTLSGNSAASGGGAYFGTLNNCIINGNSAANGGGAYFGTLNSCTVSSNSASQSGGGAYAATLNNCILSGNVATNGGGARGSTLNNCALISNVASNGGGAYSGTLDNCMVTGNLATNGGGAAFSFLNNCRLSSNSASAFGGGAYYGGYPSGGLTNCILAGNSAYCGGGAYYVTLNNCTVTANSASYLGGGTAGGTLNNCIIYYNDALTNANADYFGTLNYCCTVPLPNNGNGNFTKAPLFVDQTGGDFHLQAGSPCINAGLNAYVQESTDLDGNVRIRGGTVDVGAYEFRSPTSVISYAWLQQYGLAMDGSVDFADKDGDGLNNWQEWRAGTDPTNVASLLKLTQTSSTAGQVALTWTSVANRSYFVERATDLGAAVPFSLLQANVPGLPGTTSFTDTNAPAPAYYRVGVQ